MLQYLFGISPSLLIVPGNVSIFPLGCIDWQLHYRDIKHSSKAICRGRKLESERGGGCLVVIYSSVVRTLAAQVWLTNPGFNSLVTTTSFTFLFPASYPIERVFNKRRWGKIFWVFSSFVTEHVNGILASIIPACSFLSSFSTWASFFFDCWCSACVQK